MTQPTQWGAPRIGDAPVTPEAFANRIDDSLDAVLDAHAGADRPAYAVAGTLWRSTAASGWFGYDGAADTRLATCGRVANYSGDATLSLSDVLGGTVVMADAAAIVLTIPADATAALPVGVPVWIIRGAAGAVSVAAASGVTLNSAGGLTGVSVQYGAARLVKIAADSWILSGDLV